MNKNYYVYILGNARPTLYVGVTNNLVRRVSEHKQGIADGFTKRYGITKLLYYEIHQSVEEAIIREKHIKHWKRDWKLELIQKSNRSYDDLYRVIQE